MQLFSDAILTDSTAHSFTGNLTDTTTTFKETTQINLNWLRHNSKLIVELCKV